MAATTGVSVVIPAFNAEKFIGAAVQSVLHQTFEDLELVVIDDGSSDGTAAVVRAINDPRLRLFSGPNKGLAHARNKGLGHTSEPLVAFLDADDRWFPEKLARQVTMLMRHHDVVAVGCLMHYISLSEKVVGTAGQTVTEQDQQRIRAGRLMPSPISSILFRRGEIEALGAFDERLSREIPGLVEDIDLISRLAAVGKVDVLPQVLGAYRIHAEAASARHFGSQRMGRRFIQARRATEKEGGSIDFNEFSSGYRRSLRESWEDLVAASYRAAGLHVAERRWLRAFWRGLIALTLGPGYSVPRLLRQRPWRARRSSLEKT